MSSCARWAIWRPSARPHNPSPSPQSTNTGANQWSGLVFDGGTGELDHATVRYGGQPNSINTTCGSSGLGFNIAVRNVQAGEVRMPQQPGTISRL